LTLNFDHTILNVSKREILKDVNMTKLFHYLIWANKIIKYKYCAWCKLYQAYRHGTKKYYALV